MTEQPIGIVLTEWDWLVSSTWEVLHHATLTPEQADELEDESILYDVTLTCGRTVQHACIPGFLSRMSKPRCRRCCDRLGYPRGDGSPKNDKAIRPLVEARLAGLTMPAGGVMADPAETAREWVTLYVTEDDALDEAIEDAVVRTPTPQLCAIIGLLVQAIGDTFDDPEDWASHILQALVWED